MNQYLLNEEVHVYDFANGEPMACDLFEGVPCCIPRDDFYYSPEKPISDLAQNWAAVWRQQRYTAEKVECPENFGLVHNGENACLIRDYNRTIEKHLSANDEATTFTCDGKFFTALMKPLTNNF